MNELDTLRRAQQYMEQLNMLSEFHKSYDEDGMTQEEFSSYGGFRNTLNGFLGSYDDLIHIIRKIIV